MKIKNYNCKTIVCVVILIVINSTYIHVLDQDVMLCKQEICYASFVYTLSRCFSFNEITYQSG